MVLSKDLVPLYHYLVRGGTGWGLFVEFEPFSERVSMALLYLVLLGASSG